mgnify:CR=1 FL=1
MFEQYLLFGTAIITGIMLVYALQREAFEQRSFPLKKPASYVESAPLTWSVFTALICRDYLRPDAGTFLIIALTIGFFLVIAHMGFLIAMWRTRDGQSYFSISGVVPRIVYTMMGVSILFGSGLHIASA